jgi:hypothetical protein
MYYNEWRIILNKELFKNWKTMDESVKRKLVQDARKGINHIGFCGLHCDYCFLGEWCGGCRSECNCCSFAGMFDDGICPNVRCAQEKGIEGCYQCNELENCVYGFYKKENEAKACALFIKKYGEEKFNKTIHKLFESGEGKESFNGNCKREDAIKILEKYM